MSLLDRMSRSLLSDKQDKTQNRTTRPPKQEKEKVQRVMPSEQEQKKESLWPYTMQPSSADKVDYSKLSQSNYQIISGLNAPLGGCFTRSGERVIISNSNENRLELFDVESGKLVQHLFGSGSKDGQFSLPRTVAFDSNDQLVVADQNNKRVQWFGSDGCFVRSLCKNNEENKFNGAIGLTVDSRDNVLLAECYNPRIHVINKHGQLLSTFGQQHLGSPNSLAVNSQGHVVVGDHGKSRIFVFDDNYELRFSFGGQGKRAGLFNNWIYVDVDSYDRIVAADNSNYRVQIFECNGDHVCMFGKKGNAMGEFEWPHQISVRKQDGALLVVECGNHRATIINPSPSSEYDLVD